MAKSKSLGGEAGKALTVIWAFVAWLTGLLVALAVGFGMSEGVLSIPGIPRILTETAGWIVIVLAILGALLAIIDNINK